MTPIEKLVHHFGGQKQTAAALGVSQPAVSYWVTGVHLMKAEKAFRAEELTGGKITARELCASPQPTANTAA
jgi:DNA-binding transcriptional regulator YdaS (Cro superfamily)